MSAPHDRLTGEDLAFLARPPLHGFLTVAAGPQPPQPRPVWFEATAGGTIQLFTGPETPKERRLRRDPRASIIVAAPATERERWVAPRACAASPSEPGPRGPGGVPPSGRGGVPHAGG